MSGEVSASAVSAAFRNQARSLAEAGADALLVETMNDIDEARIAVEAARESGLPVLVSFAFDSGKDKDRTMMGATPEAVAEAMTDVGAATVGANCGVGVERAVALCRRLHNATSLPIWIKPNAGLPTIDAGVLHYNTSADFFASHFRLLRDAGASFIGACCGSNPEFVRALVKQRSACTQPVSLERKLPHGTLEKRHTTKTRDLVDCLGESVTVNRNNSALVLAHNAGQSHRFRALTVGHEISQNRSLVPHDLAHLGNPFLRGRRPEIAKRRFQIRMSRMDHHGARVDLAAKPGRDTSPAEFVKFEFVAAAIALQASSTIRVPAALDLCATREPLHHDQQLRVRLALRVGTIRFYPRCSLEWQRVIALQ